MEIGNGLDVNKRSPGCSPFFHSIFVSTNRASEPLQKRFGYRFGFLKKIKKRFGFGSRLLIEKKGSVWVRFFMSKRFRDSGRFGINIKICNILHVRSININSFLYLSSFSIK